MASTEVVVYKLIIENDRSIKSMKQLVDQQKELKKQIFSATDAGSENFEKLRKKIKENQKVITDFNRDLRNSKSIAQRVSEGVTKSFKQVGAVIAAAFTVGAIADFGKSIVELTSTINDGFARVNTVAQLSQDELEAFKEKAIEIGKQGSSALEEIPDALFDIVSATGDVDVSLDILETAVLSADAGFGSLGATSNALVNIMNAVGVANITSAEAADILFATQKEGVASFDELAKVIPNVIPAAQSVGFSFEEVSASLATLTKSGLDANASATSLRALFSSFTNKGKLENLNSALEGVGASVFDSEGKLRGLTEIVADFDKVLAQATSDEERTKLFANLKLDQNSIKALQGLINNVDTFDQISESVNSASDGLGELQTQLQLSENGTRTLGKAQNEFKAELLELGQVVTPIVEDAQLRFFEAAQKLVGILNDTIEFFQKNEAAAKALKGVLTTLAAFFGGKLLTSIFGFAKASKLLATGLTLLKSPLKGVVLLVKGLGVAIRANPLGALITAIGIAVTLWDIFADKAEIASSITKEFSANSEALAGELDTINANMAKQVTQANNLFEQLKDTNLTQEQRKVIIDQINEQYKDYLPNLLTEASSLKEIEAAQKAVNAALTQSFTLKIQEATQADALNEKIKFQQESFKSLSEVAKASGKDLGNSFLEFQQIVESLSDSSDGLNASLAASLTGYNFDVVDLGSDRLNLLVKSIRKVSDELITSVVTLSDGSQVIRATPISQFLKQVASDTGKFNQAIDDSSETIDRLTSSLGGATSAVSGIGSATKKTAKEVSAAAKKMEDEYKRLLEIITTTQDVEIKTAETVFVQRKRFLNELLDASNLTEEQRFALIKQLSEEEKRLKLTVRDATKKSLSDQLELARNFNKDSKDLTITNKLNQQKNESQFVEFVIKERIRLEKAKERISREELDAGLTRLSNEMQSAEQEISIFKLKFKKRKSVLQGAGVEEKQIEEERLRGVVQIQEKFGVEVISAAERISKATASIEFSQGEQSVEDKKQFELAKLNATLQRQQAELQLLEELGNADEARLAELRAAIAKTTAQIQNDFGEAGFSFKAFSDNFSELTSKALEFTGQLQELFNQSAELSMQALDRQAERAQLNVDRVQGELNVIDDRIATANATQKAALIEEKRDIQIRFDEETKGAKAVEDEKEALRKESFERNQTFSIISAVVNGAVAVTKAIAELGPIAGPIAGALTAAITATQVALIASQKFALGGLVGADKEHAVTMWATGGGIPVKFPSRRGGVIKGPSHAQGGVKFSAGGQLNEAEGGEFISSVASTRMFLPIYESLNNLGNRLASNTKVSRVASITRVPRNNHFAAGGLVTTAFVTRAEFAKFAVEIASQSNEVNQTLLRTNELLATQRGIIFSMSEFEKKNLEFKNREISDDE